MHQQMRFAKSRSQTSKDSERKAQAYRETRSQCSPSPYKHDLRDKNLRALHQQNGQDRQETSDERHALPQRQSALQRDEQRSCQRAHYRQRQSARQKSVMARVIMRIRAQIVRQNLVD